MHRDIVISRLESRDEVRVAIRRLEVESELNSRGKSSAFICALKGVR